MRGEAEGQVGSRVIMCIQIHTHTYYIYIYIHTCISLHTTTNIYLSPYIIPSPLTQHQSQQYVEMHLCSSPRSTPTHSAATPLDSHQTVWVWVCVCIYIYMCVCVCVCVLIHNSTHVSSSNIKYNNMTATHRSSSPSSQPTHTHTLQT